MNKTTLRFRLLAFVLAVLLFMTSVSWPVPEIRAAETYNEPKIGDTALIDWDTNNMLPISVAPSVWEYKDYYTQYGNGSGDLRDI